MRLTRSTQSSSSPTTSLKMSLSSSFLVNQRWPPISNLNSPCSASCRIVRARPPTTGDFSTTVVGTPALLSTYAEQRPPGPAPMTSVERSDASGPEPLECAGMQLMPFSTGDIQNGTDARFSTVQNVTSIDRHHGAHATQPGRLPQFCIPLAFCTVPTPHWVAA